MASPVEGIDYIVDYYSVVGVTANAPSDEVRSALNARIMEYHPDRLMDVAPEFQSKGERMAKLLNDARGILLDKDNRSEYNEILREWEGLISTDGDPVSTISWEYQQKFKGKTPEEVEAYFSELAKEYAHLGSYDPDLLNFLEATISSGDSITPELRQQYDRALLKKDELLAAEEADRRDLLGLPDIAKNKVYSHFRV